MNPNKLLGVTRGATESEIQGAFRQAAKDVHPDHSDSPEAAEAFQNIMEARDALMEQARAYEQAQDSESITKASAAAAQAAGAAAYSQVAPDDIFTDMSDEEIAHIQELDRLAEKFAHMSPLSRHNEPPEVRRHRRQLETQRKRLSGRY